MISDFAAGLPYIQARANNVVRRVTVGDDPRPLPLLIAVKGGIHCGCETQLEAYEFCIGGGEDADIMLLDDVFAGPYINVSIRPSVFGQIATVRTERTDIGICEKPLVSAVSYERLPCTFQVAGSSIAITVDVAAPKARLRPSNAALATGGAILGGLIILANIGLNPLDTNRHFDLDPFMPKDSFSDTGLVDPGLFLSIVRTRIADADFSDQLRVSEQGHGVTRIIGEVPMSDMSRWEELRRELDTIDASQVIVSDVKLSPALSNMPAVATVRLGDPPHIVLFDGSIVGVGEEMHEGWRVTDIQTTGFSLTRRDEAIFVSF